MKLVHVVFSFEMKGGIPEVKVIKVQDKHPGPVKKGEMVASGIYMNCQASNHSSDVNQYGTCRTCGGK